MTEDEYDHFLALAAPALNKALRNGLARHNWVMAHIADLAAMDPLAGDKVVDIGRKIDELIASVAIQHMEATLKTPEKAREAIQLMREKFEPRLKNG